ncbi:MAG TPA: hypothetical protein VLD62_10565, partial [Acidimicrobiia bacterium]|nr:hypothetical protein [Acidimicrobiia bacterium]
MGAADQARGRRPALGPHRRPSRRIDLSDPAVVRVVPDVPTFAVDDGFAYEVPDTVEVDVGSIVRVPLGGRRVRGWVVGTGAPRRPGLRRLLGRSGDLPVFDARLLQTLRWAAAHYVAPLAALLSKAGPPNLPKRRAAPRFPDIPDPGPSPLPEITDAASGGGRLRAHAVVGDLRDPAALAALTAGVLVAGRSVLLVAPTVVEAGAIAASLGERLPGRVLVGGSDRAAADATRDWSLAAGHPGHVVVGTREVAFWPVSGLALAVVLGEGRRGMKDKATPTTHAVDVLARRAGVERFTLVTADLVPTATTIARGPVAVAVPGGRPWGLVEVVDRNDDPPGSGLLSDRTRQAVSAVVRDGGRVLLFTTRRGGAARCVRCRTLRTCGACGARPGTGDACPRCGEAVGPCLSCGGRRFEGLGAGVGRISAEVGGFVGRDAVGEPAAARPVVVGTERDLADLDPVDLSVIVDADGPMLAPHYRASEDALRIFARVVALAGRGRGRRAIVQ